MFLQDNRPLTLQKSDGEFTYDTLDLAAVKHRVEEERAEWIVYVVDAEQVNTRLPLFRNSLSISHSFYSLSIFKWFFLLPKRLATAPRLVLIMLNLESCWEKMSKTRANLFCEYHYSHLCRKRLETRSGKTVRLLDLLDEGMARAKDMLTEKKRDQVHIIFVCICVI